MSEARWGLFPMGGSAVRLPRQIPYTVAADILLTGRHLTAGGSTGHRLDRARGPGRRRRSRSALELASLVNANGPLAVRAILRTIRDTEGLHEEEAFKLDSQYGIEVFASEDAKEGPRAFCEKRKPEFRGR